MLKHRKFGNMDERVTNTHSVFYYNTYGKYVILQAVKLHYSALDIITRKE